MCSATLSAPQNHRHLHGVIRIGAQRKFNISLESGDIFLLCKAFWKEDNLVVPISERGVNLIETFTIKNTSYFLQKMQNNFLRVEITKSKDNVDEGVIGLLHLPLHQFFIAYRDASLTNRLNDSQFPVISANKWMPVVDLTTSETLGELECLFAIGTQKQIENLKSAEIRTEDLENKVIRMTSNNVQKQDCLPVQSKTSNTIDLLNLLQKSLASSASVAKKSQPDTNMTENCSFKFLLEIKSARNLPLTPHSKINKKHQLRSAKGSECKNSQIGEKPSSYVTFQGKEQEGAVIKSHEGMVHSTIVVEKTCNPVWNERFCVSGPLKYVLNKEERLVMKVFKKASKNLANENNPYPLEDTLIGLVSVDLYNLTKSSSQQGAWFDIVDFSGHINGQLHVVAKSIDEKEVCKNQTDLSAGFETNCNINNTYLSKAIKRKFMELDEISERLRIRLLSVTGSTDVCSEPQEISDEQLEEFEHDINTTEFEDENENQV